MLKPSTGRDRTPCVGPLDLRGSGQAIYAKGTPVGFVMIVLEVGSPDYIAHYVWKLLIDERHRHEEFLDFLKRSPGPTRGDSSTSSSTTTALTRTPTSSHGWPSTPASRSTSPPLRAHG